MFFFPIKVFSVLPATALDLFDAYDYLTWSWMPANSWQEALQRVLMLPGIVLGPIVKDGKIDFWDTKSEPQMIGGSLKYLYCDFTEGEYFSCNYIEYCDSEILCAATALKDENDPDCKYCYLMDGCFPDAPFICPQSERMIAYFESHSALLPREQDGNPSAPYN